MGKIIFFAFLCVLNSALAQADTVFDSNNSLQIAKAVKLGRGKSVSTSSGTAFSQGGAEIQAKSCEEDCEECNTSTGKCITCKSGYFSKNGVCSSCPSDCSVCSSSTYCTTCDEGYSVMNGICYWNEVTVTSYHYYDTHTAAGYKKVQYQTMTISRNNISSYYDSWPDVDIYDESTNRAVQETTDEIALRCASGVGEFWTKEACEKYKSGGYYCASSGYSCGYEQQPCMISNCMTCNSDGLCETCLSGYVVGTDGSDYGQCVSEDSVCNSISDYKCYTIDRDDYIGWAGEIGYELCTEIRNNYGSMANFALADPTESVRENGTCASAVSGSCSDIYVGSNYTCTSCDKTYTTCYGSQCTGSNCSSSSSSSSTSCSSGKTYKTNVRQCAANSYTYTGCVAGDFGNSCTSSSQCSTGLCAPCWDSSGTLQGSSCR